MADVKSSASQQESKGFIPIQFLKEVNAEMKKVSWSDKHELAVTTGVVSITVFVVCAFEDLGMEAIYEFVVENFPVIVAVDSEGNNIHQQAPKQWQKIIFEKNNK